MRASVQARMAQQVRDDFRVKGSSVAHLPDRLLDAYARVAADVGSELGRPVGVATTRAQGGIGTVSVWLEDWPANDEERARARIDKMRATRDATLN